MRPKPRSLSCKYLVLSVAVVLGLVQTEGASPSRDAETRAASGASANRVAPPPATFRLWANSDSHVDADKEHGRLSLADAVTDSDKRGDEGGPSFDWDIMIHLGDMISTVSDEDGREIQEQLSASIKHPREDFYFLLGNHDASPGHWWFRKWIDPTGKHPETSGVSNGQRTFPVTGTWERYSFRVGNILFLMMADRNDLEPPVGRGKNTGGYPAGNVSTDTFDSWKEMVEKNADKIIVSAHHHMLRDTTVASGLNEGIYGCIMATSATAHRKVPPFFISWTEFPKPANSSSIWKATLVRSTCGWAPILTRTQMIPLVVNRTSSGSGA